MNLSDLRSTGVLAVVRRENSPWFSELRRLYFNNIWGMDIQPGCRISYSAKLDKNYPRGIHIGQDTAINFGACVLAHDTVRAIRTSDTWIGKGMQHRREQHDPGLGSGLATIAWSRRRAW